MCCGFLTKTAQFEELYDRGPITREAVSSGKMALGPSSGPGMEHATRILPLYGRLDLTTVPSDANFVEVAECLHMDVFLK